MQPRGGRGHRALATGKHRLIALGILGLDWAPAGDVGRQRRVSERLDRLVEIGAVQAERELDFPACGGRRYGGVKAAKQTDAALVTKVDVVADGKAPRRAGKRAPMARIDAPVQVECNGGA